MEKYRDALGKPGVGMHAHGLFGFAVFDLMAVLCVSYLIARYTNINFYMCSAVMIGVGIAVHRIFGVQTKLNSFIFGSRR